ncbi:MAG: phosphoribosylformylglycinamidine synthase I [Candidatus Thorarchaeota archaeon]
MTIAVIRFPGTNNENDVVRALKLIPGAEPYLVPSSKGSDALKNAKGVVIPGGFSYGDYLRAGAVASVGSILDGVRAMADSGKPILGICNGFQILAESGLLPGALLPNASAHFICKWVYVKVSGHHTAFTHGMEGAVIRLPIAHAEGNYYCTEEDLERLKHGHRIPFRYCNQEGEAIEAANPNGAIYSIAGITNEKGNILGMMPHPERASRLVLGSVDGLGILENFVQAMREA